MKIRLILAFCLVLCGFVVVLAIIGGSALIFKALYYLVIGVAIVALLSFVLGPL